MTGAEARDLRLALQMDRADFARLLGVSGQTVARWEDSSMDPSGTADAVLCAIREKLQKSDDATKYRVESLLRAATSAGGLAYLVVRLLDGWTEAAHVDSRIAAVDGRLAEMNEALAAVRGIAAEAATRDEVTRLLAQDVVDIQKRFGIQPRR